jgi:hypothetical protein
MIKLGYYVGVGMWHVWGRTEMQTVLVVTLEGGHVEDLGVDGRIALKRIFKD